MTYVEKKSKRKMAPLKVQSSKSYNNKYMIDSTQITNTEVFAFIAVLDFKLLGQKVLLMNRKDNRNCSKVGEKNSKFQG